LKRINNKTIDNSEQNSNQKQESKFRWKVIPRNRHAYQLTVEFVLHWSKPGYI